MRKKLEGLDVKVFFWDHSHSSGVGSGPVLCKVHGTISKATELHIEVVSWDLVECEDGTKEINQELFSILRSTIIKFVYCPKWVEIKNFK